LPFFKVKVSARRFNKLGFFGGLWDYSNTYFLYKNKVVFRPVSESPTPSNFRKSIQYVIAVIALIAIMFGTAYQIKPVKAAIIKSEKRVRLIKLNPHISFPHVRSRYFPRL